MPKLNKTGSTGPSRTLKNALNRLTLPLPLALSRSKLRGYATAAAIGYTKRLICRPRQAILASNGWPLGECRKKLNGKEMITSPHALSQKFSNDDLPDQFIIAKNTEITCPSSWVRFSFRGFTITCHPDLPCSPINDNQGKLVGYVIGQYITEESGIYGNLSLAGNEEKVVDTFVSKISGRFVVVVETSEGPRVYLDPCGSLPVVYASEDGIVATSPLLIPYNERTRDDVEMLEVMDVWARNAMYPLGLTPRIGVYRLLPGHYLDLNNWQSVRHWPNATLTEVSDIPAAIDEIAFLLKSSIESLIQKHDVQMSLTAGQDSRMLLSCVRDWTDSVKLFTYRLPDDMGEFDCFLARKIARKVNIPHRIIPTLSASEEEREAWLFRTGCSVGEMRGLDAVPMVKQLDRDRVFLPGYVCEFGRAYYWKASGVSSQTPKCDISAEILLKICHAPNLPKMLQAANDWIARVPFDDAGRVMDLFYLEQRIGCWASAMSPGYSGMSLFELWPMNNRRILDLILRLPPDYKMSARMNRDVISSNWPELLEFKFNKTGLDFKIYSTLTNPRNAFRKIFRKVGLA